MSSPRPFGQILRVAAIACALLLCAGHASAQEDDPADAARFRFGPIRFTPALSITNVGVDTNVFNEVDQPKSDTTAAIGPAVNLWTRVGRSRITAKAASQYLYFAEFVGQRSFSVTTDGRWEVPLARVTPFLVGAYGNARQRQGYEIDTFAHQRTDNVGVGADVDFGGRTKLTFLGSRSSVAFDSDETFLGVDLAGALNRASNTEQLQVRYKLTPLTTFVTTVEAIQDRFELDRVRDANSIRVLPGFELKPFALVSGTVSVGYRRFTAVDAAMPDYQGIVAAVDAKYAIGATQLNLKLNRDLAYSFEPTEPYYALNDLSLSVTHRLTSAWDFVGRAGRQSLHYAELVSAAPTAGDRVDNGRQYGAGVGYRFGRAVRVGFDTTYVRRTSIDAIREYEGIRSGLSFTYGIQP